MSNETVRSVMFSQQMLDEMEAAIKAGYYTSRSELIRAGIRKVLHECRGSKS